MLRNNHAILILFIVPALTSCLTRAPTTYELDRRAGLLPPNEVQLKSDISMMKTNSNMTRKTEMPERLPPLVEKVWVTAQLLPDGSKLDGTWMWIEVERSRWLDEKDPGSAPLLIDQSQLN